MVDEITAGTDACRKGQIYLGSNQEYRSTPCPKCKRAALVYRKQNTPVVTFPLMGMRILRAPTIC